MVEVLTTLAFDHPINRQALTPRDYNTHTHIHGLKLETHIHTLELERDLRGNASKKLDEKAREAQVVY
jgi:hypothetical protein